MLYLQLGILHFTNQVASKGKLSPQFPLGTEMVSRTIQVSLFNIFQYGGPGNSGPPRVKTLLLACQAQLPAGIVVLPFLSKAPRNIEPQTQGFRLAKRTMGEQNLGSAGTMASGRRSPMFI